MDFTALIYAFLWHIDSNLTPNIYYSSIRTTFSGNHIFFYQVCNHNFTTNKISTIKYLKPTKKEGGGGVCERILYLLLYSIALQTLLPSLLEMISSHLKLPFRFKLIDFPKIYSLRTKHIYITINASHEGTCIEFERKKQHNLGFPTFKLPVTTKNLSWLTR